MSRIITSIGFSLVFGFFLLPTPTFAYTLFSQSTATSVPPNSSVLVGSFQPDYNTNTQGFSYGTNVKNTSGYPSCATAMYLYVSDSPTSNVNSVSVNLPASTTTTEFQYVSGTFTTSKNLSSTSTYYVRAVTQCNPGDFDIKNTAIFTGSSECLDCTQVIATDPTYGEVVATSTSLTYDVNYQIAQSDNDLYSDVYIDYYHAHTLFVPYLVNEYAITEKAETRIISDVGEFHSYFNVNNSLSGTYNVTIIMYGYIQPEWWQFWADPQKVILDTETTSYTSVSVTTQEERDDVIDRSERDLLFINTSNINCYNLTNIECWFTELGNKIITGAPIGYATRIYNILSSTSTGSTTLSLTHVFPAGTPASGMSINLDLASGINTAIALYDTPVDTFEDTPWDTFMYWWTMIWYLMLAFWIISQILKVNLLQRHSQHDNQPQS